MVEISQNFVAFSEYMNFKPPWFFFEIRQVLESWVSRLKLKVLKIYLVQWLVEHEERIYSKEFQQLVAHTLVEIF